MIELLNIKKLLHTILLRSPLNLFDEFLIECQKWYELPAHSLTEMRTRNNKKIRGDIFEMFCVLYLKYVNQYENVWRLEDVPMDILIKLKLKRRDMGVDIIVQDKVDESKYYAVQCKYKKRVQRMNMVTWKSLSTFYAMCLRTGPWSKYIVMANCDYTRHQGDKGPKDLSICLGTFRATSSDQWLKMCDIQGQALAEQVPTNSVEILKQKPTSQLTREEVRALRLAYYEQNASSCTHNT